ncbi:MAG: zinc ribbon domain-containing protein, partial [Candidatus Methanomethylophilaceae archaeon]|nr:zinc ribbon domain-containing protein [Candidatus Methanomethylophilaceae archaeon]
NGDYTYRIDTPEVFITQLVAGTKNFSTAGVKQFMMNFVSEPIIQQLSKQYYLDVFGNLDRASMVTKVDLEDDFKNRGLELLAFKIGSVATEEKYQEDIYKFQQFRAAGGTQWKQFGVMEHMADAIGESQGGAAMGAGMMLFPQMYQQMSQQGGAFQQQQQPKVLCPFCGQPNDYPYRFCGNCGKPSPQVQQQQQPQAPPAPAPAPAAGGAPKSFKRCPYCGEDLSGLPKTPKFCPYCAEQLM